MSNNDLHIIDFKTEQIIAVIKEQDYWDDLRKWELKNNVDQFEFTVSDGTHKAAKLMQQNIVLKRVRDGSFVSYVINESEQDSVDRSKKIYALSEHTKLRKAKVIKPQTIESYTVNKWMDFALEGTKWQRGVTEYASFRTIHIKEFTNPLDLLKTIASTFELEIRFRTEVKGSFIVGRYVDMVRKVGRDNGKEIVLGKDLQGIRRIENSQDAISALVGVGPFNEETGEYLTFEKINGGKLYVADADALQRWTEDGSHKYDIYSPQTEDQNMSPERLKQLTEAELKKRINSTVKYEVTPIALEKIFGLSHEKVNKGDIVHIKDTKFTPPLFLEARLIAADECDTNAANDKYYFGDFKEVEDTRSLLDRMYAQVMGSLAGKANKELLNQLEKLVQETNEQVEIVKTESQTAKDIATKTKEYMEQNLVEIIENANPPTINLKPNKTLWRDISNGKPGTLKIWTGTTWELVVPDTGPLQQSIKDVQKDIETTKTELNQKVQEAQEQATGQFNEVKETLQSVSRTISDVQNEQGNINKKVTQIEQNADGFKTSIESLTKKDTEISNKLNTIESTVEGTKQTISDIQQTTSNLTKTTNEIKQTVDTNSQTISTVQKDQGTMQTTLNQVKQTTDSNFQTITTLSQTQGKQGEVIQQNTSDITQLNNQIKSKVSDKQMQEYVGGLGSTNLLFNAAFEDRVINAATGVVTSRTPSTTKWSVVGTGSGIAIVPESARHHEGYNSVKITATGQTASKWSGIMQRVPAVQNGGDYVFSTWVYVQDKNALDNGGAIKLQFFNGANAVSTFVQTEFKDLLVNNSWVLVSVKIISPNVAITHLQGDIWVRQNGTIWVSQPQLQQGSTRSTFMENPKDYANYDQLVGEIAKKVATADFDSKVSKMETTINQQSNRIDLKAEKTDVYTKTEANGQFGSKAMVEKHESSITLMSNEINSTVKKGDIISSINQTAEQITIDVAKLNINADTVVQWLTAKGINADVIKISGDKVTIDKNGITAKMADFLYEDDNGQKFSVIPRKNLIVDHCFAHITKGYQNAQFFNIQYSPFWEIHGSPAVENSIVETGMEGMINAMRINGEDWIRYKHFRDVQPGKKYTISAHFRAAILSGKKVTAEPTIRVKFGTWQGDKPVDKQIFEKKFSAPKIADGKIVRYTVTFTVPSDYNMSSGYIFFDIFGYGQVAYGQSCMVSGVQLVEGELPCIYNWDLSYAQAVSGETPFSGFTLGTVDNAFLFENNRNKIPFITAAGDGHALEIKGVSHGFVSFTDQNGRFGYIGHGSPNDNRFRISTRNNVSFDKYIEAPGINMGGGAFHGPGSMYYGEGFQGINWYINEGGWRVASI
ncbi:phage tail spike protein [Bacillus cereus]|nr:phage tail spike protein [Bacillus cereus]